MNHPAAMIEKFRAIDAMVGNTPLLAIHFRRLDRQHTIYAKAEFFNLTGSIKDRMALHVLRSAYRTGQIKLPGIPSSKPPAAIPALPSPQSAVP